MRVENFVLPLNGEVFKSRSLWLRHWSKKEPAYENQELFPTFAKGCIMAMRIKIKHVNQRKGGEGYKWDLQNEEHRQLNWKDSLMSIFTFVNSVNPQTIPSHGWLRPL